MVTARSPLRTRRAHPRGVAARLFWLGALLMAVFASHGFSAETGAGHTDPIRIVWSAHATAAGDSPQAPNSPKAPQPTRPAHQQEHGEDADHPGGECLSGKPEDGPDAEAAWSAVAAQPTLGDAAPAPDPTGPTAGGTGDAGAGSTAPGTLEAPHRIARLRV
ncbi:hypothetical protein [Kitasatospora sp. MY 5-36]|uniref:hypothetical protein n=1 Tax=Kitasatospora sp. MY 5-36 TaxID=1678027 RepID=UPI000A8E3F2B|nr:hypothetical protein [Kitasatospora sp. MY 5-36]